MIEARTPWVRIFRLVAVCALMACAVSMVTATEPAGDFAEYRALADSGNFAEAASMASDIVAEAAAANPEIYGWKAASARIRALSNAQKLTVAKLELITAGGGSPSPFAYVAPTPPELALKLSMRLSAARMNYQGLGDDERALADSAVETTLRAGDRAVIDAYVASLSAALEGKPAEMARSYMSAYVLAAHADDLSSFLETLIDEVGEPDLPLLVVEDAIANLGDLSAASRSIDALDAAQWFSWPDRRRSELIEALAEKALAEGQYNWAVDAYRKLAADEDNAVAEPAQMQVIELHAEQAKKLSKGRAAGEKAASRAAYGDAAAACAEYFARFPKGENALNVEYLRSFYLYSAGKSQEAVTAAKAFQEAHADSRAVPNAMLIEALATNDMGRSPEAIDLFLRIADEYPNSSAAGRAQFMAGYCYLATQRYVKARDCFQKVVDFHPNDPTAPRAKELLKKLDSLANN